MSFYGSFEIWVNKTVFCVMSMKEPEEEEESGKNCTEENQIVLENIKTMHATSM